MTTRNYYLPDELKVMNENLLDQIVEGIVNMPVAKVEIIDIDSTTYELTSCTGFSITLNRETPLSEFSATIDQADLWNIRTSDYANLLKPDVRKRIKIYFGQVIDGSLTYVLMFTGIPTAMPESYKRESSILINIGGKNLAHLLHRQAGTYSSTIYSGTSKELIEYWCDQAGVTYSLGYTDMITFNAIAIGYNSALIGILDILEVLGPDVEAYFSAAGQLIIRDVPWWTEDVNEYDYDEDNTLDLNLFEDTSKIFTTAEILGLTGAVSDTREGSDAIKLIYGENKKTINSGLITTLLQAQGLSHDVLKHAYRHMDMASIKVQLNPYIGIGSFMTVKDATLSLVDRGSFRASTVRHIYNANQTHETVIKGYLNESSSSRSSSSSSLSSSSKSSSSCSSSSLSLSSSSSLSGA